MSVVMGSSVDADKRLPQIVKSHDFQGSGPQVGLGLPDHTLQLFPLWSVPVPVPERMLVPVTVPILWYHTIGAISIASASGSAYSVRAPLVTRKFPDSGAPLGDEEERPSWLQLKR